MGAGRRHESRNRKNRSKSRMASCCMLLVVVAASVALSQGSDDAGGPDFSYTSGPGSKDGPEMWGKLSPKYRVCGEGKRQSPIDIVTKTAIPNPNLDTLARVYAPSDATLLNNGKDITMAFPPGVAPGTITINVNGTNKVFGFDKIHWHSPSEHTINSQRFPLELHLVHVSEQGDLAVIGVLYKIGDPDSFYDQLTTKLQELKTSPHMAAGVVDLKSLQKRTGSYFRYMGSLTTPPCTENVIWNILGKVREMSREQLDLITVPLPAKDNRPSQPLNGRTVAFYNPPNSTVSFDTI